MHFPRYWTTAQKGGVSAWGWSDNSVAEAEGKAAERLSRVLDRLARGAKTPVQRYGYPDRPMREEVVREFRGADGTLRAAVTRNSYGCLVLNTANLMIVDVDAPESRESSWLAGLFGFRKPDKKRRPGEFQERLVARVGDWVNARAGWGWRIYRTKAGIRMLATHSLFLPEDSVCKQAFETFEADPLYRTMCANQKCFRARLTPKPWRCAVDTPPARWPWASEKAEAQFRKWDAEYMKASGSHAICSLIGQFGSGEICADLSDLVEFHDQITRVESGLPLA